MHAVIITGMSGAGKTQALNTLEDQDYYCIDNLPLNMLEDLFTNEWVQSKEKVAIGVDVRSGKKLLESLPAIVKRLKDQFRTCWNQPRLIGFKLDRSLSGDICGKPSNPPKSTTVRRTNKNNTVMNNGRISRKNLRGGNPFVFNESWIDNERTLLAQAGRCGTDDDQSQSHDGDDQAAAQEDPHIEAADPPPV